MQPRSSSSTVQPLSRSRVPAMAAGAGRLGQAALRSLPGGSDRTPVPGEAERESAEARAGGGGFESPGGQGRGGAGTPPAGQGRSRPLRPLPGLNGLARDGATHQLGNRPAKRLPAHPRSHGKAEGLPGDGDEPGLRGPVCAPAPGRPSSPRALSPQAPAAPRGSAPRPSRFPPATASLPPQGYFGNLEPEGTSEEFLPGMGGREEPRRPARIAPSRAPGLPGTGGGAVAAPRGLPLGRRAGVENIPGAGWGGGSPLRPGGVSGKPGPGNRALQSHLLSEGPRGPGSALQRTVFLPSRVPDPGPHTARPNCARTQRPATFEHTELVAQKGALAP